MIRLVPALLVALLAAGCQTITVAEGDKKIGKSRVMTAQATGLLAPSATAMFLVDRRGNAQLVSTGTGEPTVNMLLNGMGAAAVGAVGNVAAARAMPGTNVSLTGGNSTAVGGNATGGNATGGTATARSRARGGNSTNNNVNTQIQF